MKKCECCGNRFDSGDAEARFRDHLIYLGWENYLEEAFDEYFDDTLCEFCVCDNFNKTKEEEDRAEYENELYLLEHGDE